MVVNYVNMQGVPLYVPAVIGDLALQSANNVSITGGSISNITDLAVADGGTGASTPAGARTSLGLTSAAIQTYETGTWTPTIAGSATAGTATYSIQVGNYTRFGNFVRLQFTVAWSAGTGGESLRVSGLPFASNGTTNNSATIPAVVSNVTLSAGNIAYFQIPPGVAYIDIGQYPTGGGAATLVPYIASGALTGVLFYQL